MKNNIGLELGDFIWVKNPPEGKDTRGLVKEVRKDSVLATFETFFDYVIPFGDILAVESKVEEAEEGYSPYCKNCDSCGESGCCDSLACCYTAMVTNRDKNCSYGAGYYQDIEFNHYLADELYNLIAEQPDLYVDMKDLKAKVEIIYNRLYNKTYEKE
jgi:hypothetical protein